MNYKKNPRQSFNDYQVRLYPNITIKEITFQVTEDCCLNCTYCYQNHKTKKAMTFETAKLFIDALLNNEIQDFTINDMQGICVDFIGGEPLLQIELIEQIWEYLLLKLIELDHPWKKHIRGSLCSNGILYFNEKVQSFLKKHYPMFSVTISLDGNKELHDSCRIDYQGNGSYDQAITAIRHYRTNYENQLMSKMTLAPSNINHTFNAVVNLINEGFDDIFLNCIYESGWTIDHAQILYQEMLKISDYLLENNLEDKIYISLFEEDYFVPMPEDDNVNWCGGVDNKMFALDPEGNYYPCIRYMESSLNGKQKPLKLGSVYEGHLSKQEYIDADNELKNVTRRDQSTDECFYCPIAKGCAWCSGFNYEEFGTVRKRTTYTCIMHKARALANVYHWNNVYKKHHINKIFPNNLSIEDSIKIKGGK